MTDITYKVVQNGKELQFEIDVNGEKAYLIYRFYKKNIAIMHTFVPKQLEGLGIASTLARAAFSYAAEVRRPVMIYCPFVTGFVKDHPEYVGQLDPVYYKG